MAKALMYQQLDYIRHLKNMGVLKQGQQIDTRLPHVNIPIKSPKVKQER